MLVAQRFFVEHLVVVEVKLMHRTIVVSAEKLQIGSRVPRSTGAAGSLKYLSLPYATTRCRRRGMFGNSTGPKLPASKRMDTGRCAPHRT